MGTSTMRSIVMTVARVSRAGMSVARNGLAQANHELLEAHVGDGDLAVPGVVAVGGDLDAVEPRMERHRLRLPAHRVLEIDVVDVDVGAGQIAVEPDASLADVGIGVRAADERRREEQTFHWVPLGTRTRTSRSVATSTCRPWARSVCARMPPAVRPRTVSHTSPPPRRRGTTAVTPCCCA